MGLDAKVYCDCFEKGRLREPPPPGCHLSIGRDGGLLCVSDDLDTKLAFDRWQLRACEHENGVLLHHRIGNIALVSDLRAELERQRGHFPMLLAKVLYGGVHAGDFLTVEEVARLLPEPKALAGFRCADGEMERFMREFRVQMTELAECALRVGKPIAF